MRTAERSLVAETLRRLVIDRRGDLLTDPKLCAALLRDYCTDCITEIHLVCCAVELGVARQMSAPREPLSAVVQRGVHTLVSQRGISPENAQWGVEAWGYALHNIAFSPAVVATSAPPRAADGSVSSHHATILPPQRVASSPEISSTPSSPVSSQRRLFQQRLHRWEPVGVLQGHHGGVRALCFNHNGSLLVAGCGDGRLLVWDVGTGQLVETLNGHRGAISSAAFHPAGLLATGSADHTVRLWAPQGDVLPVLHGHRSEVMMVALDTPGHVVSASSDRTMICWDIRTGQQIQWSSISGSIAYDRGYLIQGHGKHEISFSEPWAKKNYLNRHALHSSGWGLFNSSAPQHVAIHQKTHWVASGSVTDGILLMFNVRDGRLLSCVPEHRGPISRILFSKTGRLLLSGSEDQTLRVWRVGDALPLETLTGHSSPVRAIAIGPDDRMIVSGCDDGLVRAWKFADLLTFARIG